MSTTDQAITRNALRWLGTHHRERDDNEAQSNVESDTSESDADTDQTPEPDSDSDSVDTTDQRKQRNHIAAIQESRMNIGLLENQIKWLQESKRDDEIANWAGYTILHIPNTAKAEVVSAFMMVLNELPVREPENPASFTKK